MSVASATGRTWHELGPGAWPGKDYHFVVGSSSDVGTTVPLGIVGPVSLQTSWMDKPSTQYGGDKALNMEVCAGKRRNEGAF